MSAKANKARHKIWEEQQLSKARWFTAVMWRGFPEGHDVRRAETLADARALRDQMTAEYAGTNYGRRAVIYAVAGGDEITIFVE